MPSSTYRVEQFYLIRLPPPLAVHVTLLIPQRPWGRLQHHSMWTGKGSKLAGAYCHWLKCNGWLQRAHQESSILPLGAHYFKKSCVVAVGQWLCWPATLPLDLSDRLWTSLHSCPVNFFFPRMLQVRQRWLEFYNRVRREMWARSGQLLSLTDKDSLCSEQKKKKFAVQAAKLVTLLVSLNLYNRGGEWC